MDTIRDDDVGYTLRICTTFKQPVTMQKAITIVKGLQYKLEIKEGKKSIEAYMDEDKLDELIVMCQAMKNKIIKEEV